MANSYASSKIVAAYRFESGALTTDEKGVHTLVPSASPPTSDTTNFWEGAGSALFTRASSQHFSIADASLSSDFPLKDGNTNYYFAVFLRTKPLDQSNSTLFSKWVGSLIGTSSIGLAFNAAAGYNAFQIYYGDGFYNPTYRSLGSFIANHVYTIGLAFFPNSVKAFIYDETAGSWVNNGTSYSLSHPIKQNSGDFYIGNWIISDYHANGNIDEFIVFKDAIAATDFDALRAGTFTDIATTTTTTTTTTSTTTSTTFTAPMGDLPTEDYTELSVRVPATIPIKSGGIVTAICSRENVALYWEVVGVTPNGVETTPNGSLRYARTYTGMDRCSSNVYTASTNPANTGNIDRIKVSCANHQVVIGLMEGSAGWHFDGNLIDMTDHNQNMVQVTWPGRDFELASPTLFADGIVKPNSSIICTSRFVEDWDYGTFLITRSGMDQCPEGSDGTVTAEVLCKIFSPAGEDPTMGWLLIGDAGWINKLPCIEFWAYSDDTPGLGGVARYWVGCIRVDFNSTYYFVGPETDPTQDPSKNVVLDQWYHLVLTWDLRIARLYVNGILVGSDEFLVTSDPCKLKSYPNTDISVGQMGDGGEQANLLHVDMARYFIGEVWTQTQITNRYNALLNGA